MPRSRKYPALPSSAPTAPTVGPAPPTVEHVVELFQRLHPRERWRCLLQLRGVYVSAPPQKSRAKPEPHAARDDRAVAVKKLFTHRPK